MGKRRLPDELKRLCAKLETDDPVEAMRECVRYYRSHGRFTESAIPLTPVHRAEELVEKARPLRNERILVLFNPEFAIDLWRRQCRKVVFATERECPVSRLMIERMMGYKFTLVSELDGRKHDLVVSNPPRRRGTRRGKAGHAVWDHYVARAANEWTADGGRVALIHPSGWRGPNKKTLEVGRLIRGMDTRWLSIHSMEEGMAEFGGKGRFDMHVSVKRFTPGYTTNIRDERGQLTTADIKSTPMIPNFEIGLVGRMLAGPGDTRADVRTTSLFDPRLGRAARERRGGFRHPCINHAGERSGGMRMFYSNTRDERGLFGVPKVVFGIMAGAGRIVADKTGKYGITPFVAGLVDSPRNLERIRAAMESDRFRGAMDALRFTRQEINPAVIGMLRKDFWREFV